MAEPRLRNASEYDERDIGSLTWDASHNSEILTVSDDRLTVEWGRRKVPRGEGPRRSGCPFEQRLICTAPTSTGISASRRWRRHRSAWASYCSGTKGLTGASSATSVQVLQPGLTILQRVMWSRKRSRSLGVCRNSPTGVAASYLFAWNCHAIGQVEVLSW